MTQLTILIADDEAEAADLLGMLLGIHFPSAKIHVAHGGQPALHLAVRSPPDVAILDLEMPGMDGEALALALRASFGGAAPRLIALSGNVVRLGEVRSNGAFDHHLSKPVDVESLLRLCEEGRRSTRLGGIPPALAPDEASRP